MFQALIFWSLVAALAYLATVTAAAVVLALRSAAHGAGALDDRYSFTASRFSIPASLIVPVTAADQWREAPATIDALLALNYTTFEVVVVADELPPAPWDAFKREWELEAREIFFRASLGTEPVRMMYRSARDPRLVVVHKTPGSAADALNCGVNLARFKYVSAVEPGLAFDGDALRRAMTTPKGDPARVVGATSHVEMQGGLLQRWHSIRSLMDSRLVWRRLSAALSPHEAVVVWRRDAVEQTGGFRDAWDPHLEMAVRLQTAAAADAQGQVVRTAEIFGHRRPRGFVDYVRRAIRRQRAALQVLSSMRGAGSGARTMLLYFFVSGVLTPFAQVWTIVATAACGALGWLPWRDAALAVWLIVAGHGAVGAAARLVRGDLSPAPDAPAGTAA
jgi:hypothetical protein